MASPIALRGIVVRESDYGESDKMLTVLTDSLGSISVICKGAKNYKSRFLVCAQLFCYSDMELYRRGQMYWMKDCVLIENFYGVRSDIPRLALAQYMCEAVSDVTGENQNDETILQLLLNSLYVLSQGKRDCPHVKATFEMRLCALSGFAPDLIGCCECGKYLPDEMIFSIEDGHLYCPEHRSHSQGLVVPLTDGVATALRYAVYSLPKKIYARDIPEGDMHDFSATAEKYMLYHLDRSFRTLEFYNSVKK